MTTTEAHREQARQVLREAGSIERGGEVLLLPHLDLEALPRTPDGALERTALAAAASRVAAEVPYLVREAGWTADGRRRAPQDPAATAPTGGNDTSVDALLAHMRATTGIPDPS